MENQILKQTLRNHNSFDFPHYLKRATAGNGGEAILIFTDDKTILHDCGMAYCHRGLIEKIEQELSQRGREGLDYILLSHTHYDHVGALPYVLKRWPNAVVYGAEKAKRVFQSEGARKTMTRLGEAARDAFAPSDEEILTDGLRVDISVEDGTVIPVGTFDGQDAAVIAIATPGHTDCSYSYLFQPTGTLFTSESTGIPRPFGDIHTSILKSYHDSIQSAVKCKDYEANEIVVPHYGLLPKELAESYFDIYIEFAEIEKDLILSLKKQGLTFEEILKGYETHYWSEERGKGQPKEAFLENAQHIIRHILEVFENA